MQKNKVRYVVDVLMGIAFLLAFITGIFKWPNLVVYFKDYMNMSIVSRIHDWSGLVMGLMVFVHLALNWKWIKVMTKKMVAGK